MKKKDCGWVIQNKKTKKYYGSTDGHTCQHSFRAAYVYLGRNTARKQKCTFETVRKVSLTKTGKPKAIIGRG